MLTVARTAAAAAMACVGAVALAGTASADLWVDVDCDQKPSPECGIGIGDRDNERGRPPSNPGPPDRDGEGRDNDDGDSGLPDGCEYVPVEENPPKNPPPDRDEDGAWFQLKCPGDGHTIWGPPVWVPDGEDPEDEPSPEEVAQMAYSRLRLEPPRIGVSPSGEQLVHLPTWLWLAPQDWSEVSATASISDVSVTAVATPESVTWSMGDGSSFNCDGPGTPFTTRDDPAAESPDCGHTYTAPSGGPHEVAATLEWTVRWAGAGESGVLPGLTTSSSTQVRVVEAPAFTTQ
ncbi:hypothetical protein [Phytoactinopolyspora endophytica]|uniref:hypothetical protein n=1 Tax=Phytoactinopolyspora endophytica TaxID=1642495 RepID=UPI00101CF3FF|nr:hypothetical protein [Phytoactinopolyspora endophytica]